MHWTQVEKHLQSLLHIEDIPPQTARWLIWHVCQTKSPTNVTEEQMQKLEALAQEVCTGKPLDYVLGNAEFYGITLEVNPNVLIPRADTERLVEWVLQNTKEGDTVLDIGTGSGAIAIVLAKHNRKVTATDISKEALQVAQRNAKQHGVNITFLQTDVCEGITQTFDVVVSNPPYICEDYPLDASVKNYEPHLALFAGKDGLDVYKKLAQQVPNVLKPHGKLFLEVGYDQAEKVASLLKPYFTKLQIQKDYAGVNRCVMGEKI